MFKQHYYILFTFALMCLVLSACGNTGSSNQAIALLTPTPTTESSTDSIVPQPEDQAESQATTDATTRIYESELGPVEVPVQPTAIVALANAPNILSLGGSVVGVDEWTMSNPLFADKLEGIELVSETNLESVMALEPDLIIAGSHLTNLEELNKIAPTVVYTWGKLDFLSQQVEIGKLLNKEKEAQQWVDTYRERTEVLGEKIKEKHGENMTVSVFEAYGKDFYALGNNWARGTEILYQSMGLAMPEKVEQDALGPGYYTLSLEALPDYAGDFIVLSKTLEQDIEFMSSETWKSIPAVKNNHIIEIDTRASSYSDPITLDYLTTIFEAGFLGIK